MGNHFEKKPFEAPPVLHEMSAENRETDPILRRGDTVEVFSDRRGVVDADWTLQGWDKETGKAKLEREAEGTVFSKEIAAIELYALNRPTGSETRKFSTYEWVALWNKNALENDALFDVPKDELEKERTPEEARVFILDRLAALPPREKAPVSESEEERSLRERRMKKQQALFFRSS